ncbi:MAG: polyisoprenoid-binding protein YceI [Alphaproteobacteria bacterium]|jgi:polyisoprenoid-binding protein YceI
MLTLGSLFQFKRAGQKQVRHKLSQSLLIISMLLLTTSCVSWLQPTLEQEIVEIKAGEYTLDKDHAALLFKINHMGFSSYVGRFNEFDVSLDFDPTNIENSYIEALIDMRSIDVNNSDFAETLIGSAWLDTQNFPQAVFRSLSVKKMDNEQLRVQGELTFLGVTKAVAMDATLNGAGNNPLTRNYTLGFAANLRFKRSDFGLKKFIPVVGDEVEIEIHSEFKRQ